MVLQTFGGVYSDVDTVCLTPISSWIPTYSPNYRHTETSIDDSFIAGIEADVKDRQDYNGVNGRWHPLETMKF
jgi:mannosyltransferase OCH1-like enzyme